MSDNIVLDYNRMFRHACAFADCAQYCEREPNTIECRFQSHTVSGIVNSAFACEVFLKALLVFYGETQLRNHKLKDLWLDLEEKDEETTLSIKRSIKDWFASDDDNLFDRLLDDASEAFVYWRYIYEKQDGSININFLRGFRILLRDICCKRFYNKSWKEFVDG